jgi:hypothetical protein
MRIDIEFFRCTDVGSEGRTVRVNSGQFASVKDAEKYGLLYYPRDAEGFRIIVDGDVRKIPHNPN